MDNNLIMPPSACLDSGHSQQAPLVAARNISFCYSGAPEPVFHNLTLSLFPGQKIGLAGKNGCGKTTLFKCLTGLLPTGAGEIRLGDRRMKTEKDFCLLRRQVGFVLQNAEDQLFFPLVEEDLAFGPLNLGASPGEAARRVAESLDMVGLSGFGSRETDALSGGEKKLVAIAAILAMRPKALLLDEPMTGLDVDACGRITALFQRLECAMLIISHEMDFLRECCQGVLRLDKGVLRLVEG